MKKNELPPEVQYLNLLIEKSIVKKLKVMGILSEPEKSASEVAIEILRKHFENMPNSR